MKSEDTHYMNMAFTQALGAVGISRPNPAVGAVIVSQGKVVAQGRTEKPGQRHGEIVALDKAGNLARGATLYVTLEPCCHYGRTPPCTEAIITAGIKKVCIAVLDPNPKVHGGGYQQLKAAGIQVEVGVNGEYGKEFYQGFTYWMQHQLPWVDVKIAQSLDGFVGGPNYEPVAITGPESLKKVHKMRALSDYIVISGGTAVCDNPQLTVRGVEGNDPRRLVINGKKALPLNLKLFQELRAGTEVYSQSHQGHLADLVSVKQWSHQDFASSWLGLLTELGAQGVHRILFELGANIAATVLPDTRLWNRFYLFTAPKFLTEGSAWKTKLSPNWNKNLYLSKFEVVGSDFLTVFENVYRNNTSHRRN
ncbi:MAG: bifunctional diaminohydroxyphosphoribosylaminopyrimidine deaminase/5-amino-6-(5-phosphoribosylamino)uracil reductase RibD [Fibrobacter sp.]|nr:bifunctional diaminohydroxyphosphoribosylaminopyrimidine deaminase/5-amino-6-(5-phosphoribosylamino)uracil reductase RibD [Fibrobacter sp.]